MNDLSVTIFRPADDYEFTSKAQLAAHYAAVKRRLSAMAWVPPVKLVQPAPVVKTPPMPACKPFRDILFISSDEKYQASLLSLLQAISYCGKMPINEIISPRRHNRQVFLRQVYFYMARMHTSQSYPLIGKFCGKRDHSTVHHGVGKVRENIDNFMPMITEVRRELNLVGAT